MVLKEKGAAGRFPRGVGRMRGEGVGESWGIEGKVIPMLFIRLSHPLGGLFFQNRIRERG